MQSNNRQDQTKLKVQALVATYSNILNNNNNNISSTAALHQAINTTIGNIPVNAPLPKETVLPFRELKDFEKKLTLKRIHEAITKPNEHSALRRAFDKFPNSRDNTIDKHLRQFWLTNLDELKLCSQAEAKTKYPWYEMPLEEFITIPLDRFNLSLEQIQDFIIATKPWITYLVKKLGVNNTGALDTFLRDEWGTSIIELQTTSKAIIANKIGPNYKLLLIETKTEGFLLFNYTLEQLHNEFIVAKDKDAFYKQFGIVESTFDKFLKLNWFASIDELYLYDSDQAESIYPHYRIPLNILIGMRDFTKMSLSLIHLMIKKLSFAEFTNRYDHYYTCTNLEFIDNIFSKWRTDYRKLKALSIEDAEDQFQDTYNLSYEQLQQLASLSVEEPEPQLPANQSTVDLDLSRESDVEILPPSQNTMTLYTSRKRSNSVLTIEDDQTPSRNVSIQQSAIESLVMQALNNNKKRHN